MGPNIVVKSSQPGKHEERESDKPYIQTLKQKHIWNH